MKHQLWVESYHDEETISTCYHFYKIPQNSVRINLTEQMVTVKTNEICYWITVHYIHLQLAEFKCNLAYICHVVIYVVMEIYSYTWYTLNVMLFISYAIFTTHSVRLHALKWPGKSWTVYEEMLFSPFKCCHTHSHKAMSCTFSTL